MKRTRAGGLITAMVQQFLCIRPFADPDLALADSLGIKSGRGMIVIVSRYHFLSTWLLAFIVKEHTVPKCVMYCFSYFCIFRNIFVHVRQSLPFFHVFLNFISTLNHFSFVCIIWIFSCHNFYGFHYLFRGNNKSMKCHLMSISVLSSETSWSTAPIAS